jgi:hypothetical protein
MPSGRRAGRRSESARLMSVQRFRKRDQVYRMHANQTATRTIDVRDQQERDGDEKREHEEKRIRPGALRA